MSAPEYTFDVIRHAESNWVKAAEKREAKGKPPLFGGRMDRVRLSQVGIDQAKLLGKAEIDKPLRVFSSPATRARQTHRHSAEVMGLKVPLGILDDLHERDWGDWTGQERSIADAPDIVEQMAHEGDDFTPPNGESVTMVRERMTRAVLWIVSEFPPGLYWLHSHRNAIRSIAEPLATNPITKAAITGLAPIGRVELGANKDGVIDLRGVAQPHISLPNL